MMPQLLPYLQLCRLPTVFTAMADVCLGYLLVHEGIVSADGRPTEFLALLAASSCLYLSGMIWNDVFDRDVDAHERPGRPIPSGRVPLKRAVVLAAALMGLGVGCALLPSLFDRHASGQALSQPAPVCVALLLAACVLAYDSRLKRRGFGPLGPLAMGTCRMLNVTLGASALGADFVDRFLTTPLMMVPVGLGIYITGVTWFARTEARTSSRSHLMGAMLVVNLGLAILIGWAMNSPGGNRSAVLLALAIIVLTINRRLAVAVAQPVPERVQPAIRTMLLSIIVLDATLIACRLGPSGIGYAVVTILLLIPAMFLGRWIRMT
jgi:4-hydroxybenzoate polyprenyltransferase